MFPDVPARCVVLRVRCPGPLGSCSPVCSLHLSCCVCGVLGHFRPGHRCKLGVSCCVCGVLGLLAPLPCCANSACCVVSPGHLGSCSPVCRLGVSCSVCSVLGDLTPVHRGVQSLCCVACAVSWATWVLFTGVLARCVVLCFACAVPWASWLLCNRVRAGSAVLRAWGIAAGRALVPLDDGFS